MSFWGGGSREHTPSPNPYNQVPQDPYMRSSSAGRGPGLPSNPQSAQYRAPPSGYNDPGAGLFGQRPYDQRQPQDARAALFNQAPPERAARTPDRSTYRSAGSGSGYGELTVRSAPTDYLAFKNRAIINSSQFRDGQIIALTMKPDGRAPPQHPRYFTVLNDRSIGPGEVGLSLAQRNWIGISQPGGQAVIGSPPDRPRMGYLQSVGLTIDFTRRSGEKADPFSADEISDQLVHELDGVIVAEGQTLLFECKGFLLKGDVKNIVVAETEEGTSNEYGIIMGSTAILIEGAANGHIRITGSARRPAANSILKPDFKFQDMGIGGLDNEFNDIFRRAFASRVFPPGLVDKLGIQHVKGILLHGPPGTGKTLIARQIGKVLNAREPKVVNGPEILNKYVGASEENIRKLFADAEQEYKAKAEESGLHIIIFDELDAIFKQRGSTNSGTGVGDSVVNQLLSKMDGVDQLNNILIIGMTNRKDMIDEALLRPGRLEVHMEISLPDEKGRQQILSIHTNKMRTNGVMDNDVDLAEIAALTKNFSGAEIAGLIKDATSFAFSRHIKVGTMAGVSDDVENLRVNRGDFMHALEEVKPAFGVSEEELQMVIQNGIIYYSEEVDEMLRTGKLFVEQVRSSERTPLVSVLLHGRAGAGKTALAASIAQKSEFPFIKLISPDNMVGFSEGQKISAITRVFMDSYKSPLSVVVVDNIERLIDWTPLGARFSNAVLQTLLVLFARRPPKGRRLLILATTSVKSIMDDLGVSSTFDADRIVNEIRQLDALEHVLRDVELFESKSELKSAIRRLGELGWQGEDEFSGKSIGIKRLLSNIEMARQEPDNAVSRLIGALMGVGM